MMGPAATVPIVDVSKNAVTTQLNNSTSPRSAVICGNAAITARISNAINPMIVRIETLSGSLPSEKMERDSPFTGPTVPARRRRHLGNGRAVLT